MKLWLLLCLRRGARLGVAWFAFPSGTKEGSTWPFLYACLEMGQKGKGKRSFSFCYNRKYTLYAKWQFPPLIFGSVTSRTPKGTGESQPLLQWNHCFLLCSLSGHSPLVRRTTILKEPPNKSPRSGLLGEWWKTQFPCSSLATDPWFLAMRETTHWFKTFIASCLQYSNTAKSYFPAGNLASWVFIWLSQHSILLFVCRGWSTL